MGYEGIEELYAIGDVAKKIKGKFSEGNQFKCTLNIEKEIIFGKKNTVELFETKYFVGTHLANVPVR